MPEGVEGVRPLISLAQQAKLDSLFALCDWRGDDDVFRELVRQAAAQGIGVHAWFLNGQGDGFLEREPQFSYKPMFGSVRWTDFCNPKARKRQIDLMIDRLRRVPDLKGVHLDYIRFFGGLGSVSDEARAEAARSGLNLRAMAAEVYGAFPIPMVGCAGNRLDEVRTATVWARYDDGVPALAWNRYGEGKCLVVSLQTGVAEMPAIGEAVRKFLGIGGRPNRALGPAYVVREEGDLHYLPGYVAFLGYEPIEIDLDDFEGGLNPAFPVFLKGVFELTSRQIGGLAELVRRGASVVFFETPVLSIDDPTLQELTGFGSATSYFSPDKNKLHARYIYLTDEGKGLLPETSMPLSSQERLAKAWPKWQTDQVSKFVKELRDRLRKSRPGTFLSAAVFPFAQSAQAVNQNWTQWLRGRTLDLAAPMYYATEFNPSECELAARFWKAADPSLNRVMPGLSPWHARREGFRDAQLVDLIGAQYDFFRDRGARKFCLFTLAALENAAAARTLGERLRTK